MANEGIGYNPSLVFFAPPSVVCLYVLKKMFPGFVFWHLTLEYDKLEAGS